MISTERFEDLDLLRFCFKNSWFLHLNVDINASYSCSDYHNNNIPNIPRVRNA